eukprot:893209-Amphidinium_carterae.1
MAAAHGSTDPHPTSRLSYAVEEATALREEARTLRQKAGVAVEDDKTEMVKVLFDQANKLEEQAAKRMQEAEQLEGLAGQTSSNQQ